MPVIRFECTSEEHRELRIFKAREDYEDWHEMFTDLCGIEVDE